jgi:hypothetical protein
MYKLSTEELQMKDIYTDMHDHIFSIIGRHDSINNNALITATTPSSPPEMRHEIQFNPHPVRFNHIRDIDFTGRTL